MAEEAGDVPGPQSVVKDGAADVLLQDAEQDELLIDLWRDVARLKDEGSRAPAADDDDEEHSPG